VIELLWGGVFSMVSYMRAGVKHPSRSCLPPSTSMIHIMKSTNTNKEQVYANKASVEF
jgi:ATP-dependent protease ClpP protease subunit